MVLAQGHAPTSRPTDFAATVILPPNTSPRREVRSNVFRKRHSALAHINSYSRPYVYPTLSIKCARPILNVESTSLRDLHSRQV